MRSCKVGALAVGLVALAVFCTEAVAQDSTHSEESSPSAPSADYVSARQAILELKALDLFGGSAQILKQLDSAAVREAAVDLIVERFPEMGSPEGVRRAQPDSAVVFWTGAMASYGGTPASALEVEILVRGLEDPGIHGHSSSALSRLDPQTPLGVHATKRAFETLVTLVQVLERAPQATQRPDGRIASTLRLLRRSLGDREARVIAAARAVAESGLLDRGAKRAAADVLLSSKLSFATLRESVLELRELGLESIAWEQLPWKILRNQWGADQQGCWLVQWESSDLRSDYDRYLVDRLNANELRELDTVLFQLLANDRLIASCKNQADARPLHPCRFLPAEFTSLVSDAIANEAADPSAESVLISRFREKTRIASRAASRIALIVQTCGS